MKRKEKIYIYIYLGILLKPKYLGTKIILHYKYPFGKPANHAQENLTGESFSQGQNENFQPLY